MQQLIKKALPLTAALVLGLTGLTAQAASSASSLASDSVGSSSTSIQKSSDSSSAATKVVQGDYTIIEMTTLAQRCCSC